MIKRDLYYERIPTKTLREDVRYLGNILGRVIKEQEGNSTDAKFIQEHTLAKIIAKLAKGGLETKMFYSQDRTIIFLKIRASNGG